MKRIFISYSRGDVDFARLLASALSDAGADVWIDVEDIPAGMKWSRAIQEGLDTAEAMLVVVSPQAMESHNVEDEWQYFMDQGKPVIPIWWKPAKMPFQLHRLQYVDFQGQSFDQGFTLLLRELNRRGVPLVTSAPQAEPSVPVDAVPRSAQPQFPPRTPAQATARQPLLIGSVVALLVLMGIAALLFANRSDGTGNLADFVAEPLPAVQTTGLVDFPVHDSASGSSNADRRFSQATIPLRIYDAANDDFWYELNPPEGETGYQIAEFLLGSGAINDLLLAMVPVSLNLAGDERFISLYAEPDPETAWVDVEVAENIALIGYALDDEGTVWWLVESTLPADGELLRGWYAGDESVFGVLPVVAALPQNAPVYGQSPLQTDNPGSIGELAAGTQVRVLFYDSRSAEDDAALITAYRPIPGEWEAFWIVGDDLDLNDETLDAIEANPVFQP